MLRKFLLGIMVVSMASLAWAGVPDPANSNVTWQGPDGSLVHILPSGTGSPLTEVIPSPRQDPPNDPVDGTIEMWLKDDNNQPVFDWPWEDMWLECDGVAFCAQVPSRPNGGSTDNDGYTFWNGNLFGGGCCEGVNVKVGGTVMAVVPYTINSADNNADLVVDLPDAVQFMQAWASAEPCKDYNWDEVVDLPDAVKFMQAWGRACPIDP